MLSHKECNPATVGKNSNQGGLRIHGWKVQMGLSQSDLHPLPESIKPLRARILDEFCQVCDYNRKYAIRLLNGPTPQKPKTITRKGRRPAYGAKMISALAASGKPPAIRARCGSKLCCRCGYRGRSNGYSVQPATSPEQSSRGSERSDAGVFFIA